MEDEYVGKEVLFRVFGPSFGHAESLLAPKVLLNWATGMYLEDLSPQVQVLLPQKHAHLQHNTA